MFSGHGTAIAGLIGARPALVPFSAAHMDGPANGLLPLPYCGVDPTCEIVPISTNFDADPEQMILAFLYADLIEADVIVLPRGIDDPFRTEPELYAQEFHDSLLGELVAPCPIPDAQRALWAELAELIIKVSLRRPVVCAAGNANEDYGIYPANLASEDNGVISVGAVNALGWPCSYSPGSKLSIWAPSTDAERFDSAETRLDDSVPRDYDFGIPSQNHNDTFSGVSIISTDVPGAGGYSASPLDHAAPEDGMSEFGSYFCVFGGTSAACAIIAGFLALGRGLNQLPAGSDGVAAKAWLLAHAKCPHAACPSVMVPQFGTSTFRPVTG
ncbi:MAG: S8 family serine peptidase [Alphaproteobacteria bacterium]|nr:S8 family serine peptidase [Alphaproteobacteria bacterium]